MNDNKVFDKYILVYKKLKNIFESIYSEFEVRNEANPIEHIKCRIKKIDSIKDKLNKKNLLFNEENIDNLLHDIVGVRVVCSFLSDIETIINVVKTLAFNNVLEIVEVKDYITNPKEDSGYSSYHILVRVPISYQGKVKYVNAEIQIRTAAMDMSASLEHKLCYKKNNYSSNLKNLVRMATDFCKRIDFDLNSVVDTIKHDKSNEVSVAYPFMTTEEYNLLKLEYTNALKFVEMKFNSLYSFYDRNNRVNPIEHIKSRVKREEQIIRKLIAKDRIVSINNIRSHVKDMAGTRIVCSFLSDLEELKEVIRNDPDFEIIEEKDYVNFPKDSGYRGYHFLVSVPVYTLDGVVYTMVEIQIRTAAMEMWANLEEKICYHKNPSFEVIGELQRIAGVIANFDNQIDIIRNESIKQQRSSNPKMLVKEVRS